MKGFLLVCLGGALGSGGRYLVVLLWTRLVPLAFPVGTLTVNLLGSFAIGLLMSLAQRWSAWTPNLQLALVTGVLGGFTTYSAFSFETLALLHRGAFLSAGLYVASSLVVGLLATAGGWQLGQGLL
ncbi:MAG: fluoride efflux transporter CrcB [Deltaproteobacteria bacterium]|nr:fluoride efflux transporter CrcB [Deltaproteobacteria bacterium]